MLSYCNDPKCPAEYRTIRDFVSYIEDDERNYTVQEVTELGYWLRETPLALHQILKSYGLTCQGQSKDRKIRMANENPHTRWTECRSYGGGGGDSLIGIAGRVG
jgi:hypothetical protein